MKKLLLLLALVASPAFGQTIGPASGIPANATASTLSLGGAAIGTNALAVNGTTRLGSTLYSPNIIALSGSPFMALGGNNINFVGSSDMMRLAPSLANLPDTGVFGFSSTSSENDTPDTGLSRGAAGVVDVGNGTAGDTSGTLKAKLVVTGGSTVATLPAGVIGARYYVTDQLTSCPANGAAVTGGGTVVCPVFYNGTAWVGG